MKYNGKITKGEYSVRKCRICGCTHFNPCAGGCYWVEKDLCSSCHEKSLLRRSK